MSKEQNFEINLFPVISLLAVLISFLLLSAVWVHIGTLDVKQAVGQAKIKDNSPKNESSLWVELGETGTVSIELKDGQDRRLLRRSFKSSKNTFKRVSSSIRSIRRKRPQLDMAFVSASSKTPYHKVVKALEILKVAQIKNIGVTPLN